MTHEETPVQAAFRRLGEHCASCKTCTAVDDQGENLNLPCEVGDQLHDEYRQAKRASSVRG